MKTNLIVLKICSVLLFLIFLLLFSNCNRTVNKSVLTNNSILKNDTLTYSIIEWMKWKDNGKDTFILIQYNILETQQIDADAKLELLTKAPVFVKHMEIKEGILQIESTNPWGEKIYISVCPKRARCDSFFVQLFPCSRAEYHHYPGMPTFEESFYITGDSILSTKLETYLNVGYGGNGANVYRAAETFYYEPAKGFVGQEEFWFSGKQFHSPCGGYWEIMEVHKIFVAPINELNKAPVAINDTFFYKGTKEHLIFPLTNDYDMDEGLKEFGHQVLFIESFSDPKHGRIINSSKWSLNYIPPKEKLSDEIEYVVRDINGKTAKATIYIEPK